MKKVCKKISVVVSIYNVEHYLDKCISSLRDLTYKNIEIILVVRDSGDKSLDICKVHEGADDRIAIVYQTGKGIVNARKVGTLSASGEYIIHIDGDDWVENDWLDNAAEYLGNHNPDMIYLAGFIKEGRKTQSSDSIHKRLFVGEEVCNEIFPMFMDIEKCFKWRISWNVWSWIVNREFLLRQQMLIEDSVYLIEDAVYVFLCVLNAKSVVLMDNGNYHYVIRSDSGMRVPIGIKEGNLEMAYSILKDNFQWSNHPYNFDRFLQFFITYVAFLWEYKAFQPQFEYYLYPYSKVKVGSKVIVYGAGRFGRQVVNVIMEREDYSLVGWTDRKKDQEFCKDRKTQPLCDVLKVDFDYIVIAILSNDTALEVRDDLLQMGVPDKKIALIDASVITEDKLPW